MIITIKIDKKIKRNHLSQFQPVLYCINNKMEPLSSKFITKIAASLRNEKQVLSNLPMLADVLEVSEDVKITSCKVGSKTGYECIKSILSDWSSNKVAAEANINNLQIKFRRMGLGKAAGNDLLKTNVFES